jgi:hypothetical protein
MTRIAKNDVHVALQKAADKIVEAGGADQRISRAEVAAKLKGLQGTEKALVDVFYRFIDHRDAKPGAKVTAADVRKAVEYAKEHIINKYDLDRNGLSTKEIAQMSRTGQLAVQLARELKAGGTAQSQQGPVQGPQVPSPAAPRAEVPAAKPQWFELGLSQMMFRYDLLKQAGFKEISYINHTRNESKTHSVSGGSPLQGTTRRPGDDIEIVMRGDAGERSFRFKAEWDYTKYSGSTQAYFTVDEFKFKETTR